MLKPTGQFAGDRIFFRGDKDISILLHPVVFSLCPNLVSIMAPSESDLCEPPCAEQIWVSRLSQHSVSCESFSDVRHFAACSARGDRGRVVR